MLFLTYYIVLLAAPELLWACTLNASKRGIAVGSLKEIHVASEKVSWVWNWQSVSPKLSPNLEFVPIVNDQQVSQYFRHMMGPNEPDMNVHEGGSDLSPEEAVERYQKYLMPHANTTLLGSPSVTSDDTAKTGLGYLRSFQKECIACKIDFVCLHWYGNSALGSGKRQARDFESYVDQAIEIVHSIFDRNIPIWITEFSAKPLLEKGASIDIHHDFWTEALPYLDKSPHIQRYAYFSDEPGQLLDQDGHLNSLGVLYANL